MNLRDKVGAYRAIFWSTLEVDGKEVGLTRAAEIVLKDLARICYANRTTAHPEVATMAAAEGRRQVWMHLQKMLALTDAQVDRILSIED